MIDIELYKIYDPHKKLFSKGGCGAKYSGYSWSKKGKTWCSSGAIRSHLTMFVNLSKYDWTLGFYKEVKISIPSHWVVVRTFTENGILKQEEINAIEFYKQSKETEYYKSLRKKEKYDANQ